MTRAAAGLVALLATAAAGSAVAAEKRSLTVLFTGDNGGEIAPCG